MAKIEEVPEEAESSTSSASTSSIQVPNIPITSDSLSALDSLTVDLCNALNKKSKAEKLNLDLHDQLSQCHQKSKN